jgi:plastin-1
MNSMGFPVKNFTDDFSDGLYLLRIFDVIAKNSVDWARVYDKPKNSFQKIENCEYCKDVAANLKFSVVGIGGIDIHQGNRKLILGKWYSNTVHIKGIVWQAMRYHILSILEGLNSGGKVVTEIDMLNWANEMVSLLSYQS